MMINIDEGDRETVCEETKRDHHDDIGDDCIQQQVQEDNVALAQAMNALTVQEREQIYEEIHGIASIIEETPELVASSLQQMRLELSRVPRRKRAALDRVIFLRPSITTDDKFHLMFLRACRFDPKGAATKMYRYFTNKLELFGEDKLAKTITLDDLDADDIRILCNGAVQFVPVNHPRKGIAQYACVAAHEDVSDWKAQMRCIWYRLMAVLEDEDVQKRGIVEVINLRGQWRVNVRDMLSFMSKCNHILNDRPVRICASHVLIEEEGSSEPPLSFFIRAANKLTSTDIRIRQRFHFGSDLEIQYSLMTFGINLQADCFALRKGIFGLEHATRYLQYRREKDNENLQQEAAEGGARRMTAENLLYPRHEDVLMGRGHPYQNWPGNIRLIQLVVEYADRYMKAHHRRDKTAIASHIVQLIQNDENNHDHAARFLQRSKNRNEWEKVNDQVARNKVSQLLRSEARSRRHRTNLSSSGSKDCS